MKPLSFHFSDRNNPMPPAVEDWIERLPVAAKFRLALAINKTIEHAFAPVPTFSDYLKEKNNQGDHAS